MKKMTEDEMRALLMAYEFMFDELRREQRRRKTKYSVFGRA